MTPLPSASFVGHRGTKIMNPLRSSDLDALVEACPLYPADLALDLGCGRAELLLRLVARWGNAALGVDRSREWLEVARAEAVARLPHGDVQWVQDDIHEAMKEAWLDPLGLAACVGATHALGGPLPTTRRLRRHVRPGGFVVVGDGVWTAPPSEGALAGLGVAPTDYLTAEAWLAAAESEGLSPVHFVLSDRDAVDGYERRYVENLRQSQAAGETVAGAVERIAWHDNFWPEINISLGFFTVAFRVGSA